MTTKKCSRCDREVYSPNATECDYCLGKILLPGDARELYSEIDSPIEKSRKKVAKASDSKPADVKDLDPIERISQQLERSIEAQNRMTNLILIIAEFVLSASLITVVVIWNVTRQLRGNPDAQLYYNWIIYLLGIGFITNRARLKLFEFNLKSK